LFVAEHELALEVRAPQAVGSVSCGELRALGLVASAFATFHEAVAVQHGVNRAHCRRLDHRERADQLVANLGSAPGGVLLLDPQDRAFDLVGQFVGMAIGPTRSVVEAIKATGLVALIDLVAGDAGDPELAAQRCHLLALE